MAISYPIDPSRPQVFRQRAEDSELSRSNGYRSLNAAIVAADLVHFDGELWVPADAENLIDGLALRPILVADDAPAAGTIVTRNIEISDGAVRYGTLDVEQTNARLLEIGIIVRPAVAPAE